MRVAVIGAGLAGVTTAYELARDGHEVTVYERRSSIAAEGSFAPASVLAPGLWLAHAAVGGAGGLERMLARPAAWPWLWRRWRAARQPAHAARLACLRDLAVFSLERLQAIEAAHQLEHEHHAGVMALMRTPRHASRAQALLTKHAPLNLPARWLNADEARAAEPGISPKLPLYGALYWPAGQTANGRQFAHALRAEAVRLGVRFQFQQDVVRLTPAGGTRPQVELQAERRRDLGESSHSASSTGSTTIADEGPQTFDAVVLCSAEAASRLMAGAARPRVAWGHVHSVTAPRHVAADAGETFGPSGAVLDPAAGVTIGRMGDRLRVAGCASLGAPPSRPAPAALAHLYATLEATFPGATRTARAQPWVGRQDHLADGLPAVGRSPEKGLWLNIGHGAQAWAQAAACGRLLADQLAGRPAPFDCGALDPARLR
ncbi:NAD(P)/FAD-dependent oxidoreductase [Ideonella sp.]|uniref:NAD(P)/FAD-dependent oxidoreductase n=1 Tax=Ideonella sp. TaxID=1929293 RepID=UPI0035B07EDA